MSKASYTRFHNGWLLSLGHAVIHTCIDKLDYIGKCIVMLFAMISKIAIDTSVYMKNCKDGDHHYIGHYKDHFSKFSILWTQKRKCAQETITCIERFVVAFLGGPKILNLIMEKNLIYVFITLNAHA